MRFLSRVGGCRISDAWTYLGMRMLVLENSELRVVVATDKGSDIVSFRHQPTGTELMWESPIGLRNPARYVPTVSAPEGPFHDLYEGGWQELLPGAGGFTPQNYGGSLIGLHGEVALLPWQCNIELDTPDEVRARLSVETYRSPFRLEKRLTLRKGESRLIIDETVTNLGDEDAQFMWGHHPVFGQPFLGPDCVIDVPASRTITPITADGSPFQPASRLPSNREFAWPHAETIGGGRADLSRVPDPDGRTSDLAYLTDLREGWAAITNQATGVGFGLAFDASVFRYIWLWQPYGGAWGSPWFGRVYACGIEPHSSYPVQGLSEAIKNGSALRLGPRQALQARMVATAFRGKGVQSISPDGDVKVK
jgi:galactose mutarotase-like enzyme